MTDVAQNATGSRAVALKADGNPEGKGVNGFLLDWHASTPRGVLAKPAPQVLAELFTSMLALSANFKYRPVVGQSNYLYWIDGDWSLSLIGPEEWSEERRAGFVGRVELQRDMTWTITLSDTLSVNRIVADALQDFYDGFMANLDAKGGLEGILPRYVRTLPYYRRLYAGALRRSLQVSTGSDQRKSLYTKYETPHRLRIRGLDRDFDMKTGT